MAIFDDKSRYVKNATVYAATDRRGRSVPALTVAEPPDQTLLGEHRRKEGQFLSEKPQRLLAARRVERRHAARCAGRGRQREDSDGAVMGFGAIIASGKILKS